MPFINRVSKYFQPRVILPKDAKVKYDGKTSKSQKLLHEFGVVRHCNAGTSFFLPLGMRSLKKLKKLVHAEMKTCSAFETSLPLLTSSILWQKTDRLHLTELYKLNDRNGKEYVLSPTHEEAVANFIGTEPALSYKQYPLRLYQITSKFRDEMKPRFGLIRSKEFIMKDLYSFDISEEAARNSYNEMIEGYNRLFSKLGVKYVQVKGSTGDIGGELSHEFHFPTTIGDDNLILCNSCGHNLNAALCSEIEHCSNCFNKDIIRTSSIEVGHTFLLGTKYSKPLNAMYSDKDQKLQLLHMGSYGLGLSRIIAAAVEVLSLPEDIRWPVSMAPFSYCIIPPKAGSKEESASHLSDYMYSLLNSIWEDDVIIDDRTNLTIGRRFLEAKRFGFPFVLIIGREALRDSPRIEVFDTNKNVTTILEISEVLSYIKNITSLPGTTPENFKTVQQLKV